MKCEIRTVFVADDGVEFLSEEACKSYERVGKLRLLFLRESSYDKISVDGAVFVVEEYLTWEFKP